MNMAEFFCSERKFDETTIKRCLCPYKWKFNSKTQMQCRVIYYSCFSQDDERLHDYNVKERVDSFIKAAQDQVSLLSFAICLLSNEKKNYVETKRIPEHKIS